MKLVLSIVFSKNSYGILRKDRTYEIRIRPFDWPFLVDYEWIDALKFRKYRCITPKYKEFASMTDLCRTINRKISARKEGAFQFNYSVEHGKNLYKITR